MGDDDTEIEGNGTPRGTKEKERSRRPRVPSAISKPLLKPKEVFSKQRSLSTVEGTLQSLSSLAGSG
jgi:hypothetical protein